jgi:hypothetical protein
MRVKGASVEQAAHRIRAMRNTFEAAIVSAEAIAQLIPAMTNHEADRHVLAAAVASGADAVITANLRHFSPESCEPHGIDVIHPDEFARPVRPGPDDGAPSGYRPGVSAAPPAGLPR